MRIDKRSWNGYMLGMKPNPASGMWVGVDFDGTLTQYGTDPILPSWPMVERVKRLRRLGWEVRIFTARVATPNEALRIEQEQMIRAWCKKHIGEVFPVTATKDVTCAEIWDDIAVSVSRDKEGEYKAAFHPIADGTEY